MRYKMYPMVCHSGQLGKGFFYKFIEVVSSQSKVQGPWASLSVKKSHLPGSWKVKFL